MAVPLRFERARIQQAPGSPSALGVQLSCVWLHAGSAGGISIPSAARDGARHGSHESTSYTDGGHDQHPHVVRQSASRARDWMRSARGGGARGRAAACGLA